MPRAVVSRGLVAGICIGALTPGWVGSIRPGSWLDVSVEQERIPEVTDEASPHDVRAELLLYRVVERIACLLEHAYLAMDQNKHDRAIQLCESIGAIDPDYAVALELMDNAKRARQIGFDSGLLAAKLEVWKGLTDSRQAAIPYVETVTLPSGDRRYEFSIQMGNSDNSSEAALPMDVLISLRMPYRVAQAIGCDFETPAIQEARRIRDERLNVLGASGLKAVQPASAALERAQIKAAFIAQVRAIIYPGDDNR